MEILTVILRTVAAAIICLYGLGKLSRVPFAVDTMWKPEWMSGSVFLRGVICIAGAEVAFGFLVVLNPLPSLQILAYGLILCIVLSIYGTVALHRVGYCGCGGNTFGFGSRRLLWLRNVVLFGAATAGATLGPHLQEIVRDTESLVPLLAMLPLTGWLLLLGGRIIEMQIRSTLDTKQAAVYQRLQSHLRK